MLQIVTVSFLEGHVDGFGVGEAKPIFFSTTFFWTDLSISLKKNNNHKNPTFSDKLGNGLSTLFYSLNILFEYLACVAGVPSFCCPTHYTHVDL